MSDTKPQFITDIKEAILDIVSDGKLTVSDIPNVVFVIVTVYRESSFFIVDATSAHDELSDIVLSVIQDHIEINDSIQAIVRNCVCLVFETFEVKRQIARCC